MRSEYLTKPSDVPHVRMSDRQLADALVESATGVPEGLWLVRRQLEGVEHFALLARAEDMLPSKPDWHYLCAGPIDGRNAFIVFTVTHDQQGFQRVVLADTFDSLAEAINAYNHPLLLFGIPPVDAASLHHDLIERARA